MAAYSKATNRFFLRMFIFVLGFVFVYISGCKGRKSDTVLTNPNEDDTLGNTFLTADTGQVKKDSTHVANKLKDSLKTINIINAPIAEYGVRPNYYNDNDIIESKKNDSTPKHSKPDPMMPVTAYGTFPNNYQVLKPEAE